MHFFVLHRPSLWITRSALSPSGARAEKSWRSASRRMPTLLCGRAPSCVMLCHTPKTAPRPRLQPGRIMTRLPVRSRERPAVSGQAAVRTPAMGQEARRSQTRQGRRRAQARRTAPLALAERDRVPLGLSPAFLLPISHAPDDLFRKVGHPTSVGT